MTINVIVNVRICVICARNVNTNADAMKLRSD